MKKYKLIKTKVIKKLKKGQQKNMKEFEVSLNWTEIVKANNEEEAKEEVRKVFDSTLLKLVVKELRVNKK